MAQFFINPLLDSDERVDMSRFMESTDGFDPLTSTFLKELKSLKVARKYIVQNEAARPDLVSFRVYSTTQYWWVLLFYNGLTLTDDLVGGTVINCPRLDDIEDLIFSLRAREVTST